MEGQIAEVHTQQMQDRGMEIVDTHTPSDSLVAQLVGCAVGRPALDAAARHPTAEPARPVVPARFGQITRNLRSAAGTGGRRSAAMPSRWRPTGSPRLDSFLVCPVVRNTGALRRPSVGPSWERTCGQRSRPRRARSSSSPPARSPERSPTGRRRPKASRRPDDADWYVRRTLCGARPAAIGSTHLRSMGGRRPRQ